MIYYINGTLLNLINESWGIGLALVGILLVNMQKSKVSETKVLFNDIRRMFVFVALATASDMASLIFDEATTPFENFLLHLSDFCVFSFNCVLLMCLSFYCLDSMEGEFERRKWELLFNGIVALDMAVLVLNHFTGWIYYFDEKNKYFRGPYFWVNHAFAIVFEMVLLYFVWRYKDRIKKRNRYNIYAYIAIPLLAIILQLIINGIAFLYISETLTLQVILIGMFQENLEQMLLQQEELAESYMNSMISQIQPHFLYNVLMSIMGIEGNPPETKKALADFGKYLRGNMDVIQSKEPISFTKEMQHVDAYVSLEKLRFQENLNVEYDLQVKDFEIAALSVQMMVENAIKHGIRPRAGAGTVRIETRELSDAFLIRIIDDGVGFEEDNIEDMSRSHVGIASTRERLKIMVGGELEIHSVLGKGTAVTIKIPKMEYEDEYFSS
ncbi:MAG: histidine kinase [Dorea sp.]|nr:histidine kinase [Dorea sp.]